MYEIFYPFRDDWGKIYWAKSGTFYKKLSTAMLKCSKLPLHSYIKKYGDCRPCFYNQKEITK